MPTQEYTPYTLNANSGPVPSNSGVPTGDISNIYFTVISKTLTTRLLAGSRTIMFRNDGFFGVLGRSAKTIKVPYIVIKGGLSDYDRRNGYPINVKDESGYVDYTLKFDRAFSKSFDYYDLMETAQGTALINKWVELYTNTRILTEIDTVSINKLYTHGAKIASDINRVPYDYSTKTFIPSSGLAWEEGHVFNVDTTVTNFDFTQVIDTLTNISFDEGRANALSEKSFLLLSSKAESLLTNTPRKSIVTQVIVNKSSKPLPSGVYNDPNISLATTSVTTQIGEYNGLTIVFIPQRYMKETVTTQNLTPVEEAANAARTGEGINGGYVTAGRDILAMLITSTDGLNQIVRENGVQIFSDMNGNYTPINGYIFRDRVYYDMLINQENANQIYVVLDGKPTPPEVKK